MGEPKDLDLHRIGWFAGTSAVCLWAAVYLWLPPSFSGTDVFYFKDAGINLATGRGLVTRLGPGHPGLEPTFYASYPPAFPCLYGLVAGLLGTGPTVSRVFDVVLSSAAGLAFWFSLQPRRCRRDRVLPGVLLLAAVLISLPLGPSWAEKDRPDSLGLVLALGGLGIAGVSGKAAASLAAGALLGLNALVSPFCFLIHGFCQALACWRPARGGEGRGARLRAGPLAALLAGAAIPPALTASAIWLLRPEAASGFLGHALGTSTGGGSGLGYLIGLLSGDVDLFLGAAARYVTLKHKAKLAFLLLSLLGAIGCLLGRAAMRARAENRFLAAAIGCLAAIPVVLFPYQWTYMSVTAVLILVLLVRGAAIPTERDGAAVSWTILACFGALAPVQAIYVARELAVARQSGPSLPRMLEVLESHRPAAGRPPLLVATSPPTYFLFKREGFEPVNLRHLDEAGDRERIDLVALSFVGSPDPRRPLHPPWWCEDDWDLVYRPDLPQRTGFLGFLSAGSNTWEVELYRRARSRASPDD